MGTITVNTTDETEQRFRQRVQQVYGSKKGALGKALTEAMQDWVEKHTSLDTCMLLLEEGMDLGGITYKDREELHERR